MTYTISKLLKPQRFDKIALDRMYPAIHLLDRYPVSIIQPNQNNGPWIAGGAPICWYSRKPVGLRDIDVWCKNGDQASQVIERLKGNFASMQLSTKNAGTFVLSSDNYQWKIQVITKRYFESQEELFNYFDITVCKIATDGKQFYFANSEVITDLNSKTLRFTGNNRINLQRTIKYLAYGYKPIKSQIEYLKENITPNKNNPYSDNYDDIGENDI